MRHREGPRRSVPTVPRWHRNWLSSTPLARTIHALAAKLHPHRVLDIGCGNKPYRSWFAQSQFYFGIDVATTNNSADVVADAVRLPFDREAFDCVLCFQVLEHVEQPQALLAESCRVMKHGGWLLLSAPMTWRHHETPYDFYRYTRYGMRYLVESAGFEIQSLTQNGGAWSVVGQTFASAFDGCFHSPVFKPLKVVTLLATNTVFAFLDRVNHNEENTSNLAVLARKTRTR